MGVRRFWGNSSILVKVLLTQIAVWFRGRFMCVLMVVVGVIDTRVYLMHDAMRCITTPCLRPECTYLLSRKQQQPAHKMQNWEWIAGTVSRRRSDQPLCLDYANNIERFNKKINTLLSQQSRLQTLEAVVTLLSLSQKYCRNTTQMKIFC